jgi:enediyne biosynthesis protein E4
VPRIRRLLLLKVSLGFVAVAGGCDPDLSCPFGACDPGEDPIFGLDTGEEPVVTRVALEEGEAQICADPSLREESPFDIKTATVVDSAAIDLTGGGVLVGDFEGDGLQQIMVLGSETVAFWSQLATGDFENQSATRLPLSGTGLTAVTGGSVVDIEGDGDLDLYLTVFGEENQLWLNDGEGLFAAEDGSAGLGGGSHRTMSSAWGDMDGDGDLDLVLGGAGPQPWNPYAAAADFEQGDPIHLFENLGDGTFADVSALLPEEIHDGYQSNVSWIDLDGDMRQDLVVVNNYGWARPGTVLWNRETGFVADDGNSGFSDAFGAFGLGLGDLNADGIPDFLRTGYASLSVLASHEGAWQEMAPIWSLEPTSKQTFGWGAAVSDIDNDADLDLMVGYGFWDHFANSETQADSLYLMDEGSFVDEGQDWGFADEAYTRGLIAADFNRDGWVDVVKQRLDAGARMLVSRCGEAAWLGVELQDYTENRFGIGARIQIVANGVSHTRWLTAGGFSVFSSGPPEALFGLGDAETVESLTVTWPDGEVSTFSGIGARQYLRVTRERVSP